MTETLEERATKRQKYHHNSIPNTKEGFVSGDLFLRADEGREQIEDEKHQDPLEGLICYGACDIKIDDVYVCSAQDVAQYVSRRSQRYLALHFVSVDENVAVHLENGQYMGLLMTEYTRILKQISSIGSKVQGFLDTEHLAGKDKWTLPIIVNIYGSQDLGPSVADILSSSNVYLQCPAIGSECPYKNPQCFFAESDIAADMYLERNDAAETARLPSKITPYTIQDTMDSILPAIPLADKAVQSQMYHARLKTVLRGHQLAALHFMEATERQALEQTVVGGGLLADQPGLGKSLTALALILSDPDEKLSSPRVGCDQSTLVVVPASLVSSWQQQIEEHVRPYEISVVVYSGPQRIRRLAGNAAPNIVLTSYSTIVADWSSNAPSSSIFSRIWRRIIIDEAHFIKDQSTKRFKAICSISALARWCLTGTPIQNRVEDLAALLVFLKNPILGTMDRFQRHVTIPLREGDIKGVYVLQQTMSRLMVRRTKAMIDLPPRSDLLVEFDLSESERLLYDIARDESNLLIRDVITSGQLNGRFNIFQAILRQRQVCNHGLDLLPTKSRAVFNRLVKIRNAISEPSIKEEFPMFCELCNLELQPDERKTPFDDCFHMVCKACIRAALQSSHDLTRGCPMCSEGVVLGTSTPRSQSLQAWQKEIDYRGPSSKVLNLLQNIKESHEQKSADGKTPKSVVFSSWVKMLYLVGRALELENIYFVRFDGTISLEERQKVLFDFQNNPQITVLLISIGSGGVGLNLTAASYIHLLEPQWNPMAESQALDRIHRLGQTNPVTTYKYIAKNTFDESILLLQSRKVELAELALKSEKGNRAEQQRQRLMELCSVFK